MTSRIKDLKNQHISDEDKNVDDKVKKNTTDILSVKSSLDQEKSTIDNLERAVRSFYGEQYYNKSWLVFKADYHSFNISNSKYIDYWKSKGIFKENLDDVSNSSNKKPDIHLAGETVSKNFIGNYFKQPKVNYPRTAIAIHIVYKLNNRRINSPYFIQVNGRFGNCKLTITPSNKGHYGYTNGIRVFSGGVDEYSEPYAGKTYRNMLIYGADMTNSRHASNKTENCYCIDKSFTQGLQNTKTIYADHDYIKTNRSEMRKFHVLTVCYNGSNSYIILNGVQQAKFKSMTNLKLSNPLIIGNTTDDFTAAQYKNTSLRGNIYDVAVDYLNLDFSKLISIQGYLMKK